MEPGVAATEVVGAPPVKVQAYADMVPLQVDIVAVGLVVPTQIEDAATRETVGFDFTVIARVACVELQPGTEFTRPMV
jgi:hypothetical protein